MIKYNDFINENIIKLDGRHGFFMFLKLIDDLKFNFIKTNHHFNVGKYLIFFTTENIKNKDKFYDFFRDCLSIKITCDTAINLKDKRISFYFGVKDNKLEYGFQDDSNRDIYKTGEFEVDYKYVRSLRSYKCLVLIENLLKNFNMKNLTLLHEIKLNLKNWYEGDGKIIIISDDVLKKTISKDILKEELKDVNGLLRKYENWCEKFKWVNKVFYYIDNDDEDNVTFYIKIKPKMKNDE